MRRGRAGRWSVAALFLVSQAVVASGPVEGPWEGSLSIAGAQLQIRVLFQAEGEGLAASIDIPQQGAMGIPLQNVHHQDGRVHFELPAGPGLAVFDGALEGEVMAGDFTQSGMKGSFQLTRAAPEEAESPEPPPYLEEEVTLHNGDVSLTGTLSRPESGAPHPAVVLISGSGAQDRDEDIAGFKPFRILADHLTRAGIAVLRYDDRGVGGSTGLVSESSIDDFVSDVSAAVVWLRDNPSVDAKRIGLLGHSEGALVAAMVASRSEVASVVLLAGSAVRGDLLLAAQAEALARASGATDEDIAAMLASQQRLFRVIRSGEGWAELEKDGREQVLAALSALPEQQRAAIADPEAFATQRVQAELAMARTPWYGQFLDLDPAVALGKVSCPVLALYGGRDLQVPAELNRAALEAALSGAGNKEVTVLDYPEANHLFQKAVTGLPSEYAMLEKQFLPGLLEQVGVWLAERLLEKD